MATLILTEKPSVARAIAGTLGKPISKDGYLQVGNYIVTWAVGHLVGLAPPEAYDKAWKNWNMDHLPMIPEAFKLVVNKRTKRQFDIVRGLMISTDIEKIIFATDAADEGELIARWIYAKTNCNKQTERLWISSLTPQAINAGMNNLQPAANFDFLFKAAAARARADWVVGLNATRAVTNAMRSAAPNSTTFSVGRVQTPTLRKVVDREEEIESFEPEYYFEVVADFEDSNGAMYQGRYYDNNKGNGRIDTEKQALSIVSDVEGKQTNRVEVEEEEVTVLQPSLFSLQTLQQECSRKFGITVAEVLEVAQSLYEKGLISYPRTNDNLVTADVAETFPSVLKSLSYNGYEQLMPEFISLLIQNKRYVGEVTDHHAIIPTGKKASLKNELESKMYDFIVHIFIAAHHLPGVDVKQQIETKVGQHIFLTQYRTVSVPGWRCVFGVKSETKHIDSIEVPVTALKVEAIEQKTEPPSRFSEAALLKQMGKDGLGTAATRAAIIETLKQKSYITVDQRKLYATDKARQLIDYLKESPLISSEMTKEWEVKLDKIQQGKLEVKQFNQDIDQFVRDLVHENKKVVQGNQKDNPKVSVIGQCPKCKDGSVIRIKKGKDQWFYGCNKHKSGCNFFISGNISGATIDDDDVKRLIKSKQTTRKTFYFKNGRTKAKLILKDDGSMGFNFNGGFLSKLVEALVGKR